MARTLKQRALNACKNNDTKKLEVVIKDILRPSMLNSMFGEFNSFNHKEDIINEALMVACTNNSLEAVKILYENKSIQANIDTDKEYSSFFRVACKKGYNELVKYLLTDENVLVKPDINVGNPYVTRQIFNSDFSANTQLGAGCPFWFACKNENNELIELLLNKGIVKQAVHPVVIENGFRTSLISGNIAGARIIKDKTNILEDLTKPNENTESKDPLIALCLIHAISYKRKDTIDFIIDECNYTYDNELENDSIDSHKQMTIFLFQRKLDKELSIGNTTTKKMKI